MVNQASLEGQPLQPGAYWPLGDQGNNAAERRRLIQQPDAPQDAQSRRIRKAAYLFGSFVLMSASLFIASRLSAFKVFVGIAPLVGVGAYFFKRWTNIDEVDIVPQEVPPSPPLED